jgi:hypothetical protein
MEDKDIHGGQAARIIADAIREGLHEIAEAVRVKRRVQYDGEKLNDVPEPPIVWTR